MYSVYVLILCSLLQAGNDAAVPSVTERLRAVTPTPFTPVSPVQTAPIAPTSTAIPPVVTPPSTFQQESNPNQLFFRKGVLALPTRNHVPLAAPAQAVLKSLSTEQRDAAGNIVQDESGKPVMIPITEGMSVFKGQLLGNFDDRELQSTLKINQAQLEVAKAERNKQTELIYAARSLQVAITDYQAIVDANKRIENTFPEIEVRQAALAQAQAEANLDLQKYNLEEVKTREVSVRENELERTEVQIDQRQLIAPIDGMIVKIHVPEGKWLREGDPVLDIVQLNTLRVCVQVDVREHDIRDLDGKQVKISVPLANGKREVFPGTVIFCNPLVLSGSSMYEVNIEVQNRQDGNHWLLQPGRDDVDIVIPL